MKKILLIIISALLLIFACVITLNGINIGNLKISSIKQLGNDNENLDSKIRQLNSAIDVNYPSKVEELNSANKKMQDTRSEYLDTLTYSSNADLENTLMIKNYDIERLWARVGNHAIDAGVNITLEIKPGTNSETKNLNFTVKGTYLAQTNFLYAIEDDEELSFRIYEYKLVPSSGTILQATFIIKDVRITDSLNESLDSNSSSSSQTNNDASSTGDTSDSENKDTPAPTPTTEAQTENKSAPTPTPTTENQDTKR